MPIKCRFIQRTGEIRVYATIKNGENSDRILLTDYVDTDEYWQSLKAKYGPSFSGTIHQKVWNTEDGENNHPGDMFFQDYFHEDNRCPYWDNCKDPRGHLIVVLPNGHYFDTDSRASNCNKPNDRLHRCWQKSGEPPLVTIGGPQSDNGVGSIGMSNYHGYLKNGELVE